MNLEKESTAEPSRQLANLKQVIIRSEAAIAALKKLISAADGKIKTLEAQSEQKCTTKPPMVPPNSADKSIGRLRMFQ